MFLYHVFLVLFTAVLYLFIGMVMWFVLLYITNRFQNVYGPNLFDTDNGIDQPLIVLLWPIAVVLFPIVTIYKLFRYFLCDWKVDGFNTIQQKVIYSATVNRLHKPQKPKYDFMRDNNRKLKRWFSRNE